MNLIKLSVGSDSVDSLAEWQAERRAKVHKDGLNRHVTRMWPKRAGETLDGGSIYWVIRGMIQCRQRIIRFDEINRHDGVRMCAIVLDPELVRTQTAPRRPFQGWRYLPGSDAPPDLPNQRRDEEALPVELNQALAEIGVI